MPISRKKDIEECAIHVDDSLNQHVDDSLNQHVDDSLNQHVDDSLNQHVDDSLNQTVSDPKPRSTKSSGDVSSLVGMDRKIIRPKNRMPRKIVAFSLGVITVLVFLVMVTMDIREGRVLKVEKSRLDIKAVSVGMFEDFIPVRARVTPLDTVFLDVTEGGRVDKLWVEDGATVNEGQPIIRLSNTNLQLSVMRNEAEVIQQLNNMRTIELQLEQNRLSHRRNLVEIEYHITRLSRLIRRQRTLFSQGSIPASQLDETEDELNYFTNLQAVTLESQKEDMLLQEQQLEFLRTSTIRLEENLAFARANLDKLTIRAPVAGKLSGFDVEIGQSIERGGRLGQIDKSDHFKFSAEIDEFYLNRVDIGQYANFERDDSEYRLQVAKIYPQVTHGQFEVDLFFIGAQPDGIRRGQTIQTRLTLGSSIEGLLIPNGAFYQQSGGNWIFVVSPDGSGASRRKIRLGRRNSQFIEVLEGLYNGERVIVSSYSNYQDIDRLKFVNN